MDVPSKAVEVRWEGSMSGGITEGRDGAGRISSYVGKLAIGIHKV